MCMLSMMPVNGGGAELLQQLLSHAHFVCVQDVTVFNGLHLRIERDASDWAKVLGGKSAFWRLYLQQCEAAGFKQGVPLYVATGILSYKDADHQLQEVQDK